MPTFLETLLQRLGLARARPAIETELLAAVNPAGTVDAAATAEVDAMLARAGLPTEPAPAPPARRRVAKFVRRSLADELRERMADNLAAGGAGAPTRAPPPCPTRRASRSS